MKRGKIGLKFFAAFFLAILYVVVFPLAAGKELFLTPDWTRDLEVAQLSRGAAGGNVSPFRLSGYIGYIDEQGRLLFREEIAYDAALGPDFFVNYPAVPLNLIIRNQKGEFIGNIGESGYPFVCGGKLYILSPDGYGLARVDMRGDILWKRNFTSLITVADMGDNSMVLGFLNGAFTVLGEDGSVKHEVPAERGNLAAALQAGIADDALYFTCLSGGSPQRLRLFVKQETGYAPLFETPLQSSYRRAVVARYFSEPDHFVFEQPGGAMVFQVENENRLFALKLPGQLVALADERPEGLLITLSSAGLRMYCEGFLPNGSRVFGFSYNASPAGRDAPYCLGAGKGSFLLGEGSRLYHIKLGAS